MSEIIWKKRFISEIKKAEISQSQGNEGLARVCARRAAGVVIKEYLARNAKELPRLSSNFQSGASVLNNLKYFCDDPDILTEYQQVASHFLLQLTPDHELPGNPDLIADAYWLAVHLVGFERSK